MKTNRQDLLKIIAMVTMLIDHIGVLFFPEEAIYRQMGRLAFPIYAYFLALGFVHTRSRIKYFSRLLLFALISQVPFVWLNHGSVMDLWQVNQVPMLLYAGLVLVVLEQAKKNKSMLVKVVFITLSLMLAFVPEWLMFKYPDLSLPYGAYGILLSLLFYWFEGQWVALAIGFVALSWFYPYRYFVMWSNPEGMFLEAWLNVKANFKYYQMTASTWINFSQFWNQNNALFALPIIFLGRTIPTNWKLNRWLAYWFYPGHIAVLVLIYHFLVK